MILGEEETPPVQAGSWRGLSPAWCGNHHSTVNAALLEPPGAKLSSTPSSLQLQGLQGCWLAQYWIPPKPGLPGSRLSDLFRETILLFVMLQKHYYLKVIYYSKISFFLIVPELTCSHATLRYRLVTGSLDFFVFYFCFTESKPLSKCLHLAVPDADTAWFFTPSRSEISS